MLFGLYRTLHSISFGFRVVFWLVSAVLYLIGWIHFKEFAQENKESQNETSNLLVNANLELIKTLMIISFALGLFISALFIASSVGYYQ